MLNFHCTALEATSYFNEYDQMFFSYLPPFYAAINSLQLEISRAYHPMYPSSITESCDNSVKQVIVASGSVSLLVDIMFCDDKRLERRRAYRKIAKISRPGLIFFKGPF